MILSRIALDADKRETMRLLAMPQLMHGAVEQSFAEVRHRRLWRLDWLDGKCFLLVLSEEKPDFTGIASQYGFSGAIPAWESRDYDTLLGRLLEGQCWQFRLTANPTHSVKESTGKRGKIMAHVTAEQQKQWLMQRAGGYGFSLDMNTFDVVNTQWLRFQKGSGREVTLRTAAFEGLLSVTDTERFRGALIGGIGRAKAYGCGLLTIIRPKGGGNG